LPVDRYTDLCTRIQESCRQRNWYGPEARWMNYRGYFDAEGKLQIRVIVHDPHAGFEFPPATEEQLQATEEALGISLPPMLRALYAQVANGGFGPAYGITGACGGYYLGDDGRYQTIDMCTDADPAIHYLDLREYEQAHGNPTYFKLRETIQPAHFLHLCYEGCNLDFHIDGKSGRVYLTGYCESLPDSLVPNQALPGELRPESIIGYQRVADSLEGWLERWLRRATIRFEVEQKRHMQ
jgi:hypothetical protein